MVLHGLHVYMYNVTQTEAEGPEHMLRFKLPWPPSEDNGWEDIKEESDVPATVLDEILGVVSLPASVESDINRIDNAIGKLTDRMLQNGDVQSIERDDVDAILDALYDARSSLTYMAEKVAS